MLCLMSSLLRVLLSSPTPHLLLVPVFGQGIDEVKKRVAKQQDLFELAASSLEDLREAQWQQVSRKPDVATALHVLGSGAYPCLPRNVFQFETIAGQDTHKKISGAEGLRRAEHALQAQLIREALPVGTAVHHYHGVHAYVSCRAPVLLVNDGIHRTRISF